jgi:site-specific DNA-methyltransferase (cytosine-N4-specific)
VSGKRGESSSAGDLGEHIWKPLLLPTSKPFYATRWGAAYVGDSENLLQQIPDESINLIVTSPPYALTRKKKYGNVSPSDYVSWFFKFTDQFKRILSRDGSLVINIGGSWVEGEPRKALYNFDLLTALSSKFVFIQDFYWYNPAKLPAPAEWVTVRRMRIKDAVEPIWWFAKINFPKANNKRVLKPYSESMIELFEKGYKPKLRPSGHDISTKFSNRHEGAIPPNLLIISNTESNSRYLRMCRQLGLEPNPARYPGDLPEFFIKFLTEEGDIVLDPFAGSNTTGAMAEQNRRRWLAFEISKEYLHGSLFRFDENQIVESEVSVDVTERIS